MHNQFISLPIKVKQANYPHPGFANIAINVSDIKRFNARNDGTTHIVVSRLNTVGDNRTVDINDSFCALVPVDRIIDALNSQMPYTSIQISDDMKEKVKPCA